MTKPEKTTPSKTTGSPVSQFLIPGPLLEGQMLASNKGHRDNARSGFSKRPKVVWRKADSYKRYNGRDDL